MLEKIQSQLEHLSESERKVAKVILASPDNTIHSSITALALGANVSEPTMNRLCRGMDTCGPSGFKFHLAQSLANGTPYVNRDVSEDDSVESYTERIFEPAMAMLGHVRYLLDKSAISHTTNLLTQAKRIAFPRLGSLATVVHSTVNESLRFNAPVAYSDDIVLQRMSCMNCSGGDAVVLISHTGRTENLVKLAQLACENDAMVIALTSAGTLLVRETTLIVTLDASEDTDTYMSMVSQFAQLTVIGMLATGFTLRRGTKFRDNLERIKETSGESRFDKQLLNLSGDR